MPLGSKMLAEDIEIHVGGGGANVAATFNKMGFRTGLISCIGADTRAIQNYIIGLLQMVYHFLAK